MLWFILLFYQRGDPLLNHVWRGRVSHWFYRNCGTQAITDQLQGYFSPFRDDQTQAQAGERPGDVQSALKEVLKSALITNNLARGIRETCKALDR